MQQHYGVNVCTAMSMMSDRLMPSACEVDVAGVVDVRPAAGVGHAGRAVDWNNVWRRPDKCVFFHCGNWAKSFLPGITIATAPILGTTLGEENTYGAISGRTPAGPVTYARITTDDVHGAIRAYVGEGDFTDDPLETFGSRAVVKVPRLQELLQFICRNGFEHHAAMTGAHCATIFADAVETYMGWPVYRHGVRS